MSDGQDPPRPRQDPEGVRIIGADEAEAALEREDVARRRSPEEPRPGDRPGSPPTDAPEPVLRFPMSSQTPDPRDPGGDLPHWSDPPTGEYTAASGGGGNIFDEPGDAGIEAGWSAFSTGPRWRDGDDEWSDQNDVSHLGDEETRVGALDETERDPEDFFSFDEVEDAGAGSSVFEGDQQAAGGYYDEAGNYVEDLSEQIGDPGYGDQYDEERRIVVGGGRITPGGPRNRVPAAAPEGPDRDIGQAAIVGGALFVVALVLFAIGPWAALLLVTAAVTFAAAEFFTKLREIGHQPAALLGVVASGALVIGAYHRGTDAIAVGLFLVVAASMLWFLIGAGESNAVYNIGLTLLGVTWIGVLGAFGGAILAVQGPGIGNAGNGILFGAILATIGYDLGGWFIGRNAGSRPLSEASPNKTVEGLVGGCVAALAVAVVYGTFVEPLGGFGNGVKLGLAVAVAAPLGDLCQSLIKRDLGVKDMGSILPGHGGLTDRFDGMLFVLPTVYFVARLSDFFL